MSIADKLTVLAASKEMVRLKLGIGEDVPFSEYSDHIGWDGITSDLGQSTTTAASQKLVTDREALLQTSIATILGINTKLTNRINALEESNISNIFNNGDGIWLDPSDLKTMFQNASGASLPVTKDGDPVGLMLDKSQGLEGAVTNVAKPFLADMNNDNLEVTNTSDGTKIVIKRLSTNARIFILEVGKTYKLSVVYSMPETSDNIPVYNTGGGASNHVFTATKGVRNKVEVTLTARERELYFRAGASEITIHEIVLKEIKGNHASQPLAASRPTYRTDGVSHWLAFDGVDDFLLTTGTFKAKNLFISTLMTQRSSGLIARTVATAYILRIASGFRFTNAGGGLISAGYGEGNKDIFTFNTSLDGDYIRLNSVAVSDRPINTFDLSAPYFIGSSVREGNTEISLGGNIYGVIAVDSLMSINSLFTTEQYLQRKAGVEI